MFYRERRKNLYSIVAVVTLGILMILGLSSLINSTISIGFWVFYLLGTTSFTTGLVGFIMDKNPTLAALALGIILAIAFGLTF